MTKNEPFDYTTLNEIVIFKGEPGGDLVELSRDGKYINLVKPKEVDKRYYRFDLQKKAFERINFYKTKPTKISEVRTENITKWFTNCRLITKDLHFGRLVVFAKYNRKFDNYSSPVRFVEQLGNKMITSIEQWEALGIKVEEVEKFFGEHLCKYHAGDYRKEIYLGTVPRQSWYSMYTGGPFIAPSDLSKEVLSYIKKNIKEVSNSYLDRIKYSYNNGEYKVQQELMEVSRSPEFAGIFYYPSQRYRTRGNRRWVFGTSGESMTLRTEIIHLIQEYNLDYEALCRWIKKQQNVEKNDLAYLFGNTHHYRDYLRVEYDLNDGALRKMNKYPDNFRTQFHRIQTELDAKNAIIDRLKFKEESKNHEFLSYKDKKSNFGIFLPKDPEDIKHEATILNHCVRSYIKPMTNGETLILFCRPLRLPDEPFVTIEVKNGTVTQAYGLQDSRPTDETLDFIKKWATNKNLKIGCWTSYFNKL